MPVAVTLALRGLGFRELLLCFLGVGPLLERVRKWEMLTVWWFDVV